MRHFQDNWSDFRHLKVLSYHDTKDDMMTDNTSLTDPTILLPVQDGNVADSRKQGVIFFACNSVSISLLSLMRVSQLTHASFQKNIISSCRNHLNQ